MHCSLPECTGLVGILSLYLDQSVSTPANLRLCLLPHWQVLKPTGYDCVTVYGSSPPDLGLLHKWLFIRNPKFIKIMDFFIDVWCVWPHPIVIHTYTWDAHIWISTTMEFWGREKNVFAKIRNCRTFVKPSLGSWQPGYSYRHTGSKYTGWLYCYMRLDHFSTVVYSLDILDQYLLLTLLHENGLTLILS